VKITSVETIELSHVKSRASGPAAVLTASRGCLLVAIHTDEGLTGWGEAIGFPGIRGLILDGFAPRLVGQDPREIRRTWRDPWMIPYESALGVSGVDVALHDLQGKALGVPIHQLYGGAYRHVVPAYASAGLFVEGVDPKDHWLPEAKGLVERGFKAIKMRMGRYDPDYELELMRDVRAEIPKGVRLMVDAWGSYTLPTALRVGRALQDMDFFWYEEPLNQNGYHAYEVLTSELDIAIAGGENTQSRDAAKALFDRRAVDILQPDVSLCGGIADFLFMADLAALYGIRCIPHSWNSAITAAASAHVAALLPETTLMPGVDVPLMEYDTTENLLMTDLLATPLEFRDGGIVLPEGPGLGVEIDMDFVAKYRVDSPVA
jgi:D-galactarolactone cycloisomerase